MRYVKGTDGLFRDSESGELSENSKLLIERDNKRALEQLDEAVYQPPTPVHPDDVVATALAEIKQNGVAEVEPNFPFPHWVLKVTAVLLCVVGIGSFVLFVRFMLR